MLLALISSHHWAWTLHQLAFFRHPLGRNVTHGRFSIGDALAAAHLITPMGRISCISEWSNLCSYRAINSPCMATAMTGYWVLIEICTGVTLRHALCGELHPPKMSVDNCQWCRRGLTSSQPPYSTSTVNPFTCCIGKITSFKIPTWIIYFKA